MRKLKVLALVLGVVLLQAQAASVNQLVIACSSGRAESCGEAGMAYLQGKGTKFSYDKAYKYFKRACDLGRLAGCRMASKSIMAKAASSALPFDEYGCKKGDGKACRQQAKNIRLLTEMTSNKRQTVTSNKEIELWKRGCSLDDAPSCALFARNEYAKNGASKTTLAAYKRACKLGDKTSCEIADKQWEPNKPIRVNKE